MTDHARIYDFDRIIDRHGTGSLKYDCAEQRGHSPELIPLWVADMDFAMPDEAIEALQKRAAHGIFGYTEPTPGYIEAALDWTERHQGWRPDPAWLTMTPGVVYALACCVRAYAQPGEAVLIQQPVYYPFKEVIEDNDRVIANCPLVLVDDGGLNDLHYTVDLEAFERTIVETGVKLFLLCNPHNPGGHVWTRDELEGMCRICIAHDVVIVSDEIHADFNRAGYPHVSVATLGDEVLQDCVICTAPTKTFNMAGLQTSNIWIPNEDLRARFKHANAAAGYSQINAMGIVAGEACYRYGDSWLEQLKDYLEGNLDCLCEVLTGGAPELRIMIPESTYLVWIDCRALGLSDEGLTRMVEDEAGLWLDMGDVFGEAGSGFIRVNIACPRTVLRDAMERLARAVAAHRK